MKCRNCGNEIKAGEVFCSNCGKEIQIVPDYNDLEEKISNAISASNQSSSNATSKRQEIGCEKRDEYDYENVVETDKKDKKKIALLVTSGIITIVAIILVASMFITNHQKNQSFDYQYDRALSYFNNQLPDKALESINKALDIQKNDEKALLLKAKIYLALNDKDQEINTLLSLIQVNPQSFEGYSMLINAYAEKGQYQEIAKLADASNMNEAIHALFTGYVPVAPIFKQEPGKYDDVLKLELVSDANSQIYYTIDGSSPETNGLAYTQEIELQPGEYTVRVVSTNEYGIYSEIIEGKYVIEQTIPAKPVVSLPSGTYNEAKVVSISVPEGCTAYYTWDGSIPNASANRYTGPFEILEGNNILSVIIINENNKASEVARFNYIYYNLSEDDGQN